MITMFYLINETLTEIPQEQIKGAAAQYVAVLSSREWALMKDSFDMGIDIEPTAEQINTIRGEIRNLRVHYEHLLDFSQELEENENNFFKHDNLRYFRLFSNRIERLRDSTIAIADHTVQIRDVYNSHLEIKQNRIMTILTVVTTIFMPLTLIAGWYGMNFRYMPELDAIWGYPVIIFVSILIVVGSLLFFKKKKWL